MTPWRGIYHVTVCGGVYAVYNTPPHIVTWYIYHIMNHVQLVYIRLYTTPVHGDISLRLKALGNAITINLLTNR